MDDLGTILSVQNTASLKKSSNLETFTSTKENQILHGYGLKNALHTVEDSGGMGEVSCEMVCFNLLLFGIEVVWEQKLSFGNKNT